MIKKSLLSTVLLVFFSISVYADQISARNIIEGSLDDDVASTVQSEFNGIEASVLLYDAFGNSKKHPLNQELESGQKFKIRVKSTTDGVLQVAAKNSDGTQQNLPELYIQRGQEVDYPPLKNTVLELNQQKGREELILTLIPYDYNELNNKNILEGVVEEEVSSDASYIIAPTNTPLIKRILLIHR